MTGSPAPIEPTPPAEPMATTDPTRSVGSTLSSEPNPPVEPTALTEPTWPTATTGGTRPAGAPLPFDGPSNVRDLGGFPVTGGGCTRTGVLYRADGLHALTDADRRRWRGLGIELVVDLRSAAERAAYPDAVDSVPVPLLADATIGGGDRPGLATHADGVAFLERVNRHLVDDAAPALGRVLALLAAAEGPAAFHCTAGKDRTGLVAALLLDLAGVPRPAILDDYARSASVRRGEHVAASLARLGDRGVAPEAAAGVLGAPPEVMAATLDHLVAIAGSTERYLLERAGLEPATLDRHRRRLVDPAAAPGPPVAASGRIVTAADGDAARADQAEGRVDGPVARAGDRVDRADGSTARVGGRTDRAGDRGDGAVGPVPHRPHPTPIAGAHPMSTDPDSAPTSHPGPATDPDSPAPPGGPGPAAVAALNGPADRRLEGRVALVTGGAAGMGAAHARVLADLGAHVVVADLDDAAGEAVARSVGGTYHHLDVADADGWAAAVAAGPGPVTVLVNNAGIAAVAAVQDTSVEDWDRVLAVNLTGVFLGIRAVAAPMAAAGGGVIVNVSSDAGLVGMPRIAAYSASKWGVRGLTRSAALDLAADGIRVVSLHPGIVRTPMGEGVDLDAIAAHQPIARPGTVDELAALLRFVVVDATYSTGCEFIADGGHTAGIHLPV